MKASDLPRLRPTQPVTTQGAAVALRLADHRPRCRALHPSSLESSAMTLISGSRVMRLLSDISGDRASPCTGTRVSGSEGHQPESRETG